jgi:hypothetical protein
MTYILFSGGRSSLLSGAAFALNTIVFHGILKKKAL